MIVGHVDQCQFQLLVNFLELAAQLPFQVRVDDGQWLVKQHRRNVAAHESPAQRNLLFGVGAQAAGASIQLRRQLQHFRNTADALPDMGRRHAPIAQRKGQVVGHRHGVVHHRKLEYLGNIALLWGQRRHVTPIKQDAAVRRRQQTGYAVQQGGFAAAGGAKQGIGAAVAKCETQRQQRIILVRLRVTDVRVGEVQCDFGHSLAPRGRTDCQ